MPKRIYMLHCLLLKELVITVFGDDLYRVILGYGPVETMFKGFPDDQTS
jgi:hypothetical protein